jgi:hypothetical protein
MEESSINRSSLFKVLLVLSFIGSSWSMFSGLSNALSQPSTERVESFVEIMDQVQAKQEESGERNEEVDGLMAQIIDYVSTINLNIVNYGAVEFMLYAISLIGVYLMYRNKRIGFAVYMIAQILVLGAPIYFGGYNSFSVSLTLLYAFITMIFMVLYSTQLKYMDA